MNEKIKLYRKSGNPVALEAREAYDAAFKVFYDKAAARAQLNMLLLQRFLSYGERALVKHYNVEVVEDLPQNAGQWSALIAKYEDVPIMVARTTDGLGIVGVLMDTLGPQ